jgi:hypothetical protein
MAYINRESAKIVIGALQTIFQAPGNILTYKEYNFLKKIQSRLEAPPTTGISLFYALVLVSEPN